MKKGIAVIGECMLEVKPHAALGFGGDTLNFSIYLARSGTKVSYVTALGDDPMSDWMLSEWREEGIDCSLVKQEANAVPGLYLIDVDEQGERSFYYWRDQSPASKLFDDVTSASALCDELAAFEYLYLSGITLAIYSATVRDYLFEFFDAYRKSGGKVLFDNNYRPRQWHDKDEARDAFEKMYRRADIALPTMDDEELLFGDVSATSVIERLQSWGIAEVVLKQGSAGCIVATTGEVKLISTEPVKNVVDTTAAGDSFNAGYLGARMKGHDHLDAAAKGNALAAEVIQHRGAITPKE